MSKECELLHNIFNKMKRFSFPFEKNEIPKNGIYVLFEKDEKSHNCDRIVRVGTHTGKDQLYSRLLQHFFNENKDRSIFRKNIGRAILNKLNDPYLKIWELDFTSKKGKNFALVNMDKQQIIEKQVTKYLQDKFSFIVFEVEDLHERLKLESKIISTIALCQDCSPSENWLGNFSTKEKIKTSGLWLVNELNKQPFSIEEINNLTKHLKLNNI